MSSRMKTVAYVFTPPLLHGCLLYTSSCSVTAITRTKGLTFCIRSWAAKALLWPKVVSSANNCRLRLVGSKRSPSTAAVSYTHLDVYKRQGQLSIKISYADAAGIGNGGESIGEITLIWDCLLYTSILPTADETPYWTVSL